MTTLECPMTDCKWNVNKECGKKDVCLKWRAAINLGGNVVLMECLSMELPESK